MPEGRIRVVFGAVGGHGDALVAGGQEREAMSIAAQNARAATMEAGGADMAGEAHALEWGVGMSQYETMDAQQQVSLGEAHHTVVGNSSECVQRAISRLG